MGVARPIMLPRTYHIAASEKRNSDFSVTQTDHLDGSRTLEYGAMQVCLLTDIREELLTLNRLLGCARFLGIPTQLAEIAAHTKKRPYTRRKP